MPVTSPTSYPDFEQRVPRATVTAQLRKMCARLDVSNVVTAHSRDYRGIPITGVLKANAVWVVGSYARGAATCGDLDLVVNIEQLEGRAEGKRAMKDLLGAIPRMHAYRGTPDDNTSGVSFEEAVLLWTPGADWESSLAGIAQLEGGSRFTRDRDAIPLRIEQCHLTFDQLERLLQDYDEGLLRWDFIPLSQVPLIEGPLDFAETEYLQDESRRSLAQQRAARHIVAFTRYLRQKHGALGELCGQLREPPRMGATEFFYESQQPSFRALRQCRRTRTVMLTEFNTRGPNGFWMLELGEKHPLKLAVQNRGAWLLVDSNGNSQYAKNHSLYAYFHGHPLDLYDTQAAAEQAAFEYNQWARGRDLPDHSPVQVALFEGNALLERMQAAQLDFEDRAYALKPVKRRGELLGHVLAPRSTPQRRGPVKTLLWQLQNAFFSVE